MDNTDLLDALADFVWHFEGVFDNDWEVTEHRITDGGYICGTFLNPKVGDERNNWGNRGALLESYRRLTSILEEGCGISIGKMYAEMDERLESFHESADLAFASDGRPISEEDRAKIQKVIEEESN